MTTAKEHLRNSDSSATGSCMDNKIHNNEKSTWHTMGNDVYQAGDGFADQVTIIGSSNVAFILHQHKTIAA
jgi:hypothetical protein